MFVYSIWKQEKIDNLDIDRRQREQRDQVQNI